MDAVLPGGSDDPALLVILVVPFRPVREGHGFQPVVDVVMGVRVVGVGCRVAAGGRYADEMLPAGAVLVAGDPSRVVHQIGDPAGAVVAQGQAVPGGMQHVGDPPLLVIAERQPVSIPVFHKERLPIVPELVGQARLFLKPETAASEGQRRIVAHGGFVGAVGPASIEAMKRRVAMEQHGAVVELIKFHGKIRLPGPSERPQQRIAVMPVADEPPELKREPGAGALRVHRLGDQGRPEARMHQRHGLLFLIDSDRDADDVIGGRERGQRVPVKQVRPLVGHEGHGLNPGIIAGALRLYPDRSARHARREERLVRPDNKHAARFKNTGSSERGIHVDDKRLPAQMPGDNEGVVDIYPPVLGSVGGIGVRERNLVNQELEDMAHILHVEIPVAVGIARVRRSLGLTPRRGQRQNGKKHNGLEARPHHFPRVTLTESSTTSSCQLSEERPK